MRVGALVRVVALLTLSPMAQAQAQDPAAFYKGKSIDLYIGYSAGGG